MNGHSVPTAEEAAVVPPDEGAGRTAEATAVRELKVPASSLVVLVGVSGSGKSTFARERFGPYETVSSDVCRGLVSNDENDQSATAAAFEVLETIVSRRLASNLLTVVDATNVQREARRSLVALARAASTSSVPRSTWTLRNPSRCRLLRDERRAAR